MPKGKQSASEKISSTFKSLDLFGEGIGFTVGGNGTHRTCFGACLSLIAIVVTISYAQDRFKTMLAYGDTTQQVTRQETAFSDAEPF